MLKSRELNSSLIRILLESVIVNAQKPHKTTRRGKKSEEKKWSIFDGWSSNRLIVEDFEAVRVHV